MHPLLADTSTYSVKSAQTIWERFGLPPDFTVGELISGLGVRHAQRDLLRIATILASVPVGIVGLRYLATYGNKDIYGRETSPTLPEYVVTPEEYYEVLKEEKQRKKEPEEQIKTSSVKCGASDSSSNIPSSSTYALWNRLVNIVSQYPLLSMGALAIPSAATYFATEYALKPLEKGYIKQTAREDKKEYLRQLRQTALLAKKVMRRELTIEDVKQLPEDVRQEIATNLTHRTGTDYYSLLDVPNPAATKAGSHTKQGFLDLIWSIPRLLYTLPTLSFGLGVLSGVRERPIGSALKKTEEAVHEWRAQNYPYLIESRVSLPPPEFFEENPNIVSETEVQKKRPTLEDEEEQKIVNRYIQERLKAVKKTEDEESGKVTEKKVRGTKIIS